MAVRSSTGGCLHADVAAGARSIVDDQLLTESTAELHGDYSRRVVGRAARRKRHDETDRSRRPRDG